MNGNAKILFFCMIFVGGDAFGQTNGVKTSIFEPLRKEKLILIPYNTSSLNIKSDWNIRPQLKTRPANISMKITDINYNIIRPDFYTQNFGFFCKKELQLEKIVRVPVKIRLGSVQQCDWLEGKRNAGLR
jgi:hypothetical protein